MGRAESAWPGRAATRFGDGRLKLASGDTKGALAAFDEALALEPRAVSDPATLRDHARALARGGRRAEALAAYRALAPQAALLPLPARADALVEAGLVAMSTIEPGLPEIVTLRAGEAMALLREARSLGATPIATLSHEQLKAATRDARAIVRTGEFSPYANVILRAGVVF